ncbi:flavin monoamine oxidase family protein [Evansella halocellulosilytica]|uniref:flavin monoamine oxidase family protein n=1 Tax=Evansella halocellulosilytica TaxID=2011013 RepID=UPI000BB6D33F|nr:flavin monoamine oxidase family protein [Evansella halocellulosilytica]
MNYLDGNFSSSADASEATKSMLKLIKSGLPKTNSPKKVIILGAGMAGLVSGYLLKQAGHKVTILEGNKRIGGRVNTIREPFTGGNYFEAGAMRILSHHFLTLALIEHFNLPLKHFIHTSPNDLLFVNNQLIRKYQYEQHPELLQFPVDEEEHSRNVFELLQSALDPFIETFLQSSEPERRRLIKRFDRHSMSTFLRENPLGPKLSPAAIQKIKVLIGIEGFPDFSFIDIVLNIIGTIFHPEADYREIEGGNDQLPQSFLPHLHDDIKLGQIVKRIKQQENGGEVFTANEAGEDVSSFTGDCIINTIPFSVFQFIDVEPHDSISFWKWKTIRNLHYVPSVKIGMEFSMKFWEDHGMFGGKLTTDQPLQFVYYPSREHGQPGPGVIQACYSWGDKARLWEKLTEEERMSQAKKYLSLIHGDVVQETFMNGRSFSWTQNRFSGGCFAIFAPYQAYNYPEIIRKREGIIHFAGEHTSLLHGWIEGAVESGIRVANEVNMLTS